MHKTQETFLAAITKNPDISIRQLGALLGENTSTAVVRHHLDKLVADGYIKKGSKWVVLEILPKSRQTKGNKA